LARRLLDGNARSCPALHPFHLQRYAELAADAPAVLDPIVGGRLQAVMNVERAHRHAQTGTQGSDKMEKHVGVPTTAVGDAVAGGRVRLREALPERLGTECRGRAHASL